MALTQDLSVYVFLGRAVAAPPVRRIHQSSRAKVGHLIHVRHRDEVEPPITDWLLEAYTQSDELTARARSAGAATRARARAKPRSKREPAGKAARRETTAGTGTSRRG